MKPMSRIVRAHLTRLIVLLSLSVSGAAPVSGAASAWAAAPESPDAPHKPPLPTQSVERLIVRYADERNVGALVIPELPAGLAAASAMLGVELTYVRQAGDGAHVLRLSEPVDAATAEGLAAQLAAFPNVAYAEPDYRDQALLTPDDTRFAEQWGLSAPGSTHYGLNAEAAWDLTTGDPNLTVAVIDTGILFTHPDLVGRTWPGYDFIDDAPTSGDGDGRDSDATDPGDWTVAEECGPGSDPEDSSWHGTHVAGTIGAAADNGEGVAGVNWSSRILPLRVLGKCGGWTSDIADAIRWAAGLTVSGVPANPHPARVINLSLGGRRACPVTYQSAIDAVRAVGAVVVVAAGNSADDTANHAPANCEGVIAVGASDRHGNLTYYSNYGARVDVSAPGGSMTGPGDPDGILSTYNDGLQSAGIMSYGYLQGTSMAAPHVAGVASLMLSANPDLLPDQVANLLVATVTNFPAGSECTSGCGEVDPVPCTTAQCGAGIVDAAAVSLATALTQQVYLPSLTNTAAPADSATLVGDFEGTRAWPWTATSPDGLAVIGSGPAAMPAHGGQRLAWLGALDGATNAIERVVFVSAERPGLTFWQRVVSTETTTGHDIARVRVDGALVWTRDLLQTGASALAWEPIRLDLGAYAGRVVTVRFEATTDARLPSSWLVDDVAFGP